MFLTQPEMHLSSKEAPGNRSIYEPQCVKQCLVHICSLQENKYDKVQSSVGGLICHRYNQEFTEIIQISKITCHLTSCSIISQLPSIFPKTSPSIGQVISTAAYDNFVTTLIVSEKLDSLYDLPV